MITLDSLAAAMERLGRTIATREEDSFILVIAGDSPDEQRPLQIEVRQAEGADGSSPAMIRFTTGLPWQVKDEEIYTVRVAAHECTEYLVLGHFEIDDDGIAMLIHTGMYQNDQPPSDELLGEVIELLEYEQLHFGDYLEQIITGQADLGAFAELVEAGEQMAIETGLD